MTQHHIMVDLETVSTEPEAGILSIGAVEFSCPIGGFAYSYHADREPKEFYERISFESLESAGFHISPETMAWWDKTENKEARMEAFGGSRNIAGVLIDFSMWLISCMQYPHDDLILWSNGADFDCVILAQAYERVGLNFPIDCRNYRCFRTLKNLMPPNLLNLVPPNQEKHNALSDAKWQAQVADVGLRNLRWAV